jgi:capsular polysaccharide export protein
VLSGVPIGGLYRQVQEVHTIGSLSGFEALLRGLRVVTWGRPFYAGWGLTEDRDPPADPPPPCAGAVRRRWRPGWGVPLELDGLVAAALVLYPRSIDPVTGLPCPAEVLLERLVEPVPSMPSRHAAAAARVPVPLRAFVARASRFLAEWWATR